jgi:hypothetical protein
MAMEIGDFVTVNLPRRQFNGTIIGEGRTGKWWMVIPDGYKNAVGCHKSFCTIRQLEIVESTEADAFPHVTNKPRLGFVAEHGSRDRPAKGKE